jgi:hypothetical protein
VSKRPPRGRIVAIFAVDIRTAYAYGYRVAIRTARRLAYGCRKRNVFAR